MFEKVIFPQNRRGFENSPNKVEGRWSARVWILCCQRWWNHANTTKNMPAVGSWSTRGLQRLSSVLSDTSRWMMLPTPALALTLWEGQLVLRIATDTSFEAMLTHELRWCCQHCALLLPHVAALSPLKIRSENTFRLTSAESTARSLQVPCTYIDTQTKGSGQDRIARTSHSPPLPTFAKAHRLHLRVHNPTLLN